MNNIGRRVYWMLGATAVLALVLVSVGPSLASAPDPGDNPTQLSGPALRGWVEFYPNADGTFVGTCKNIPIAFDFSAGANYGDVQDDRDFVGSVVPISLLDMPVGCRPPNTNPAAVAYLRIVSAWAGTHFDPGGPDDHWQVNVVAMFYLED
jgi:hypothetical protein